jgi:hypothetical protein
VNLSDALHALDGQSDVTPTGDGARLVALRHNGSWRVAFRLARAANGRGPWEMTEFATTYTGSGSATVEMLRRLPLGELLRQARGLVAVPLDNVPTEKVGGMDFVVDLDAVHLAPFFVDGRGRARPM